MTDSSNGAPSGTGASSPNGHPSSNPDAIGATPAGSRRGTATSRFRELAATRDQQRAETLSQAGEVLSELPGQLTALKTMAADLGQWYADLTTLRTETATAVQELRDEAKAGKTTAVEVRRSAAAAITWRVWALASVPTLLLGLLVWAKPGALAELLMSDEQRALLHRGQAVTQAYTSPRASVRERCQVEALMGWQHQEPAPCPPGTGPTAAAPPRAR